MWCGYIIPKASAHLTAGKRFDLLVTDYAMPSVNGVALIGRARATQPGLPTLVVTGFAAIDHADIPDGVEVLRKPFHREELVEAVLPTLGKTAIESPIAAGN